MKSTSVTTTETSQEINYEPPCVERVLTAKQLEREVLYAGSDGTKEDTGGGGGGNTLGP